MMIAPSWSKIGVSSRCKEFSSNDTCALQKAIGQGAFPVIHVSNDAEIADPLDGEVFQIRNVFPGPHNRLEISRYASILICHRVIIAHGAPHPKFNLVAYQRGGG